VNWDALGALAELLGAAGVVVSLVYLALQIRRSNALAVAEAHRYSNQISSASILAVAQHGDLAKIFREGLADRSALTADDRVRFDMFLGGLITALAASITDQMTLGIYGHEFMSDQRFNLRIFLSTPGGSAWWKVYRASYPEAVQRFVDNEILHTEPPAA
jgi:hypothetical protein